MKISISFLELDRFTSKYKALWINFFEAIPLRVLEKTLFLSAFSFFLCLSFRLFFFFSAEDFFDLGEIEKFSGLINAILFSIDTQITGLIFFVCMIAYLEKNPSFLDINIEYKKITVALIALKIVTFISFLPLPNTLLNILIIGFIFAFPSSKESGEINQIFWFFVIGILFHEFILITVELFNIGLVAQVRNNIPSSFHSMQQTLFNLNTILDPFLMFYIVSKYKWELEDFEKFFKYLLYFSTIVAIEFLVISFAVILGSGISIDSAFNLLMFNSEIVGSYHIVGRLALIGLFFSLYLFSKYREYKHIFLLLFMFGLMFSTLNRQVVLSGLLCLGIIFIMQVLMNEKNHIKKFLKLIPVIIIVIGVPILANIQVQNVRGDDAQTIVEGIQKRSLKYAKAGDVVVNIFPLGSGVGLQQFFSGSRLIPTNLSDSLGYAYAFDLWEVDRLTIGQKEDTDRLDQQRGFSVHNSYLEIIVELGLIGIILVLYLLIYMAKHFFHIFSIIKRNTLSVSLIQLLSVFMMIASVMISILATSKFNDFWLIALAIGFLNALKNSSLKLDQEV